MPHTRTTSNVRPALRSPRIAAQGTQTSDCYHPKKNDQGRVRVGALSAGTWRRGHVVGTEAREEDVDGGVRNVDRASMTGTGYIKENKPNS